MRHVATLLLLIAVYGLVGQDAEACSCISPPPPVESLAKADYVALVAINSSTRYTFQRNGSSWCGVRYEATVVRRFKGVDDANITLETSCSGASCGVDFEEGTDVLIYTWAVEEEPNYEPDNDNPRFSASICHRITTGPEISAEVEELEKLVSVWTPPTNSDGICHTDYVNSVWFLSCTTEDGPCSQEVTTARVYDLAGRQVATLPVEQQTDKLILRDPGLPTGALWARVGSCTIRLR